MLALTVFLSDMHWLLIRSLVFRPGKRRRLRRTAIQLADMGLRETLKDYVRYCEYSFITDKKGLTELDRQIVYSLTAHALLDGIEFAERQGVTLDAVESADAIMSICEITPPPCTDYRLASLTARTESLSVEATYLFKWICKQVSRETPRLVK